MDAGGAVEGVDLESRVVCNRRLAKLLDHRTRLGDRIRPVVTALVGKLPLARPSETDQLELVREFGYDTFRDRLS